MSHVARKPRWSWATPNVARSRITRRGRARLMRAKYNEDCKQTHPSVFEDGEQYFVKTNSPQELVGCFRCIRNTGSNRSGKNVCIRFSIRG